MKTLITLIISGFLATSCYTQFATVQDEYPEDYTVRDDRNVYPNDNEQVYSDNYQDSEFSISDENYGNEYSDGYYNDTYEPVYISEYHYSARPYVYKYRFVHYDPWDPYYYDYDPYWGGVSVSIRFGRHYDPYWTGFYCGPYDYWYYDPWDPWCGYPMVRYEPYYNPYYRHGYYGWGWGYNYGYYGHYRDNYRNPRYLGSAGHERRGFDSSRPSLNPARPGRTPLIGDNNGRINTPDMKPVISRPARPVGDDRNNDNVLRNPMRDNEVITTTVKTRPGNSSGNDRPNLKERPVTSDRPIYETERKVVSNKTTTQQEETPNRRYERKYYNTTSRIKSELSSERNEAKSTARSSYPVSRKTREDYSSGGRDNSYSSPVRSSESRPTGVSSSKNRSGSNYSTPTPTYDRPKTSTRPSQTREARPNYERSKSSDRSSSSSNKSVNRPSDNRESRSSGYSKPSTSSRPSYSTPRSSGSSSRSSSSVRSTPSRSSSGSSARPSSSGKSSSGSRSKRNN